MTNINGKEKIKNYGEKVMKFLGKTRAYASMDMEEYEAIKRELCEIHSEFGELSERELELGTLEFWTMVCHSELQSFVGYIPEDHGEIMDAAAEMEGLTSELFAFEEEEQAT